MSSTDTNDFIDVRRFVAVWKTPARKLSGEEIGNLLAATYATFEQFLSNSRPLSYSQMKDFLNLWHCHLESNVLHSPGVF